MNRKVDVFLSHESVWKKEYVALRSIALASGLTEELKWGQPCYTLENKNVFLLHVFKGYCAILFLKGALLKDAKGLLVQQTPNVQAGRQLRFTDVKEIIKSEKIIKQYISEAIAIESAGMEVKMTKAVGFEIPKDIQAQLKKTPGLMTSFKKLTPGRQRGYVLYFSAAKQEKTRDSRIEKCAPRILDGKGLND
ncbi:MAG: YdeI/OmpD-associated family protein [bacterium]